MLAAHLGLRWLRRRRAAWLALAAIALTVAVPIIVVDVMQGWLAVTARQARAAESDVVVESHGITASPRLRERLQAVPGIAAAAPFTRSWGVMSRAVGGGDLRANIACQAEGIDWSADWRLGRIAPAALHQPPVLDLSAPPMPPEQRGTGFLTPAWRAATALAGLHVAAALGGMPAALPPAQRPRPGIVCGREMLYPHGMLPGEEVQIAVPNGSGGTVGKITAEISDTIALGVLEIDRFLVLAPLPLGQRLAGLQARGDRPARLSGWRLAVPPGGDPAAAAAAVRADTGLHAVTWQELRGNLVKGMEIQRNIGALVMILIQCITVFIVYAVFSTMVVELRHDLGVLRGIGARRRDVATALLLAGLAACVAGGLAGWALGWGVLAALNPLSRATGIALFPQEVMYTPEAPIAFAWWIPPAFILSMTAIGLVAVALPAWRAARVQPIDTLREGA